MALKIGGPSHSDSSVNIPPEGLTGSLPHQVPPSRTGGFSLNGRANCGPDLLTTYRVFGADETQSTWNGEPIELTPGTWTSYDCQSATSIVFRGEVLVTDWRGGFEVDSGILPFEMVVGPNGIPSQPFSTATVDLGTGPVTVGSVKFNSDIYHPEASNFDRCNQLIDNVYFQGISSDNHVAVGAYGALVVPCEIARAVGVPSGGVVVDAGVAATLPEPGEATGATITGIAGDVQTLTVEHHADGGVFVHDCGPEPAQPPAQGGEPGGDPPPPAGDPPPPEDNPPPAANDPSASGYEDYRSPSAPRACKDKAYKLWGGKPKWKQTFQWRFNRKTTPGEIGAGAAETGVIQGVRVHPQAHNSCGLQDNVGATESYLGTTDRRANVTSGGACAKRDNINVVDFGDLPKGKVGFACATWTLDGPPHHTMIHADFRLNKSDWVWTTKPNNQGCVNEFSVRGVAAHEAGHVFGHDGDLKEAEHGNLTMSAKLSQCDDAAYTLGRGDVLGLRALY